MLYYDLNKYQIPKDYTYKSYINEAVSNIRKGNNAEYYKDTLFRLTYPVAVSELNKYANIDEVTELLPIMSISFMKTVEKFDCKKQNSSFMNYYKRTMHNDIILAYDKHRETNEKTREEIKKRIKTMASLDYLVNISADDEVPVYALVKDDKARIDEKVSYEELVDVIFETIDTMFSESQQKKKDIFISYINACIAGEKMSQKKAAKEFGVTVSYVSKVVVKYKKVLKDKLKRRGYEC